MIVVATVYGAFSPAIWFVIPGTIAVTALMVTLVSMVGKTIRARYASHVYGTPRAAVTTVIAGIITSGSVTPLITFALLSRGVLASCWRW